MFGATDRTAGSCESIDSVALIYQQSRHNIPLVVSNKAMSSTTIKVGPSLYLHDERGCYVFVSCNSCIMYWDSSRSNYTVYYPSPPFGVCKRAAGSKLGCIASCSWRVLKNRSILSLLSVHFWLACSTRNSRYSFDTSHSPSLATGTSSRVDPRMLTRFLLPTEVTPDALYPV